MTPYALEKTGTCHSGKQWKVEGREGGKEPLNAPHKMFLFPAKSTNKL